MRDPTTPPIGSLPLPYHGAMYTSSHENAQNMRLIISPNVQRIGACLVNSDENLEPTFPSSEPTFQVEGGPDKLACGAWPERN